MLMKKSDFFKRPDDPLEWISVLYFLFVCFYAYRQLIAAGINR